MVFSTPFIKGTSWIPSWYFSTAPFVGQLVGLFPEKPSTWWARATCGSAFMLNFTKRCPAAFFWRGRAENMWRAVHRFDLDNPLVEKKYFVEVWSWFAVTSTNSSTNSLGNSFHISRCLAQHEVASWAIGAHMCQPQTFKNHRFLQLGWRWTKRTAGNSTHTFNFYQVIVKHQLIHLYPCLGFNSDTWKKRNNIALKWWLIHWENSKTIWNKPKMKSLRWTTNPFIPCNVQTFCLAIAPFTWTIGSDAANGQLDGFFFFFCEPVASSAWWRQLHNS